MVVLNDIISLSYPLTAAELPSALAVGDIIRLTKTEAESVTASGHSFSNQHSVLAYRSIMVIKESG